MLSVRFAVLASLMPVLLAAVEVRHKGDTMTDELTADSLLQQADGLFQKRDYETALEEYKQAVEQARREFNRSVETEALAQVARMLLNLNKKEEGRGWLSSTAETASDSDPMGWSRYLGVRGRFEWKDDDLAKARETFDEMYVYCNTNGLWSRVVDAAHMIAIVAETPDEQIEWSRRGIEAAETGGEESWLGPLWNNLAATYYDEKLFDSALSCYLKARDYHWQFSGEIAKLFADYHVGMAYRMVGNLDEAETWLRPVLAWAERLKNHSVIGQALQDLGEIAVARGQADQGLQMLIRARSEYKLAEFDETWPEVWDSINKRIEQLGG